MAASTSGQHEDASGTPANITMTADVFHDDNAIDDADDVHALVADGFRPAVASPRLSSHLESGPPTIPSPRSLGVPRSSTDLARRSSIRKSLSGLQNPFIGADDDDDDDEEREGGSTDRFAPYPSIRPLSSASSNVYAQTHGMHIDSSGPSHPYAMYPQATGLERTLSATTANTIHPSIRTQSTVQPSHPYTMYPQNVQDEDDEDYSESSTSSRRRRQNLVPVGFPRELRRDPDNVSLFTNSEQLPPYSEYPEHAESRPANTTTTETSSLEPQAPAEAHPRLLINIPPQSMSDTRRSLSSLPPQVTDRLLDDQPTTPKQWKEKTWKQKRSTKFFGVQFGWILLALGLIVFVAIVVGGTVGGFVARGKARRARWKGHLASATDRTNGTTGSANDWEGSEGSGGFYDAQPIPHVSATPLPTGEFDLNLGPAEEVQSDCLPDSQGPAWDCNMFDAATLMLQINNITRGQGAFIYPKQSTGFGFGTRAPTTVLSMINLVIDRDSPDAGNAYQFQVLYNKLVILSHSTFNQSSTGYQSKKRSPVQLERRDLLAGERPWFCYWNNTMLEGFIYLDHAKSETLTPSSTAASNSSESATAPCKVHGLSEEPADSKSTECPTAEENLANTVDNNIYTGNVKLEERRIAGSPSPYCTQMQILDNGIAAPVVDPDSGDAITINLQENDPTVEAYNAADMSRRKTKRGLVAGSCHCQWFSV